MVGGLKKEIEYQEDHNGISGKLFFLQSNDKREIDFVVLQKKRTAHLIETKLSDSKESKNFQLFEKYFPNCEKIQLVKNLSRQFKTKNNVRVKSILEYLSKIDLS